MKKKIEPFLYTKPATICKDLNEWEKNLLQLPKKEFAKIYMLQIQQEIKACGLKLRMAELNDIKPMYDFITNRFDIIYIDEISLYDIYRFIEYGHGVILEDENNIIKGSLFEIGYQKGHKISYSIRLGIDEKYKGNGLGRLITTYCSLYAMKHGSKEKKGIIYYDNIISHHMHLNQMGWIVDYFILDIAGLYQSFSVSMPLTPESFLLNRIDMKKLLRFIDEHHEGTDFKLINYNETKEIQEVCENGEFKIIAFVMASENVNEASFFAMPVNQLIENQTKEMNTKFLNEH